MPVFPQEKMHASVQREVLVDTLAQELARQGEVGDPLVFENPLHGSDNYYVIVIWSAWRDVLWSQRSGIIFDAYQRSDQMHPHVPSKADRITTASGMTWEDADAAGFFPYGISPQVCPGEVDPKEVQKAMLREGGVVTPTGVKLRFKLSQTANEAFARLQQTLPQARWTLYQIVPATTTSPEPTFN